MDDYVIDENVVLNAVQGKKPTNSNKKTIPTDAESVFIYNFFRNKDRNFVNDKIQKKFFTMPKKVEQKFKNEFIDSKILPRFLDMLSNSDKFVFVDGIKNNFKGVKECDTEFVGVTLQSNAILVTADSDLKKAIKKDNLVSKCKCMTVEEIIDTGHSKKAA